MKASFILLPTLAVALPCRAESAKLGEFAYGIELRPTHEQPVHAFELPERVLRALTDREHGDLCVFDDQAVQRPLALQLQRDAESQLGEAVVPHFPLEAPPERSTDGVEVRVERDPSGSITRAFSKSIVEQGARVAGYLVDLTTLRAPLVALTLTISAPRDYTVQLAVESSDDLSTFRRLQTATLAHLVHGGSTLRHDVVELPSELRARYVRLTFMRLPDAELRIDGVLARMLIPAAVSARRFVSLSQRELAKDERITRQEPTRPGQAFSYAIEGVFRFDRYSVLLPASTPLSEGSLLSAPSATGPYREIDRALFRQQPSERALMPVEHGFYELRISDKGGGIREGAPTLRLGYLPPRLLFASNGSALYTLAYGSASARCRRFDESDLAAESDPPGELPTRDTVQALRAKQLAGASALKPREPPPPIRLYVLWGVLLVAVAGLAVAARKLIRGV